MSNSSEQWNPALRAILTRATADADFRVKCLKDPAAAAKELGVTLPAGATFSETAGTSAILLPPLGSDPDEIHDEVLLADAAGGSLGPEYGGSMTNSVTNPTGCPPQNP